MFLPDAVANAAKRGDLRAVKAWLARPSSEIDAMDGSRWTLLHHTCLPSWLTAENVAVAEYLLSRGASVNIGDSTALHIAIARPTTSHSTDIIDLLLRAGADVNAREIYNVQSPIAWAIEKFRDDDLSDRELTRVLQSTVQLLRRGASLADGFFGFEDGEPRSLEDFIDEQTARWPDLLSKKHFIDCQAILAGVKTAGSWRAFRDDKNNPWRAYERVPRKAVLRLRSLVARKRAKTTNPLFNTLFASPNEIVWHVLGFWRVRVPS